MPLLQLPYGRSILPLDAPDGAVVLEPRALPALADPSAAVRAALTDPIASAPLRDLARGARTATIVVNDITRPCPSRLLVEALLEELAAAGLSDRDVTLLVATGNHRPNTPAELEAMLGADLCRRLRVVNHDGRDPAVLVTVGVTPRGVPVEVNRLVVEPDLTILTGNISPHQTAGFSGGRKSIMPGVASERSLRTHHSAPIRSLLPVMGQIDANAFHEEAVAAARIVGVDFIVNSVKNSRGELVAVVAGDLEAAHAAGVARCEAAWRVNVGQPFDVAVVSAGGYPKDIDLHQAQKAVASAELVTRPGAPIVLVAKCSDGMGRFAAALLRADSPQVVIDEFLTEGFRGDEHTSKAYMFARALREHPIVVVSDRLERETLQRMFLDWAPTPDAGLTRALAIAGPASRIAVAPHAVDCIFSLAPVTQPADD
ncbi:MAG TPA: nickel-dependent lactate racemase [Thermomicrobiaceae bacterium]|nr:nickel-dependent lactate racemase [Thermomicrobiaceae bacterium]